MTKTTWYMGDTHGDWRAANESYDRYANIFGTPDLLVQVGDYGFYPTWDSDNMWDRKFDHPCYFIDGNHEMHAELWARCNGRLEPQHITDTWTYMPRGTFYDGVLYVGGAASIDKEWRIENGIHWSDREELSAEEYWDIITREYENVHTIVSHTFPEAFDVHDLMLSGLKFTDPTTARLEGIRKAFRPDEWYFGHMHGSKTGLTEGCRWRCLDICEIWITEKT